MSTAFKVGDTVELLGPGWSDYGILHKQVKVTRSATGGFGFYNQRGNWLFIYRNPTNDWYARVVSTAGATEKTEFFKEMPIDISDHPSDWAVNGDRLIQKATEQVRSEIRRTHRSWPYNQEIHHELDRINKKIKFYWGPAKEQTAML